jgi:hypothetical protein
VLASSRPFTNPINLWRTGDDPDQVESGRLAVSEELLGFGFRQVDHQRLR